MLTHSIQSKHDGSQILAWEDLRMLMLAFSLERETERETERDRERQRERERKWNSSSLSLSLQLFIWRSESHHTVWIILQVKKHLYGNLTEHLTAFMVSSHTHTHTHSHTHTCFPLCWLNWTSDLISEQLNQDHVNRWRGVKQTGSVLTRLGGFLLTTTAELMRAELWHLRQKFRMWSEKSRRQCWFWGFGCFCSNTKITLM